MSGHHPATVRLAGRKQHARFESSEALAELPAVARTEPWSCMDAAPGRRLQRRSSANILTAWPRRVAQAPRAGRALSARSLVLLTMLAPVVENRTVSFTRERDQLQLRATKRTR